MQEYQSLIDALFKLPFVRYAVVSDSFGKRLAGGMKPGVQTYSSRQTETKLEIQAVLILKMAEEFEPQHGRLFYGAVRWQKVVALFFLLSQDQVVTITVEGDTPLQEGFNVEALIHGWRAAH